MNYIESQRISGFKKGDVVKIIRKAKMDELGWDNSWESEMDDAIGKEFVLESDGEEAGFDININGEYYLFPYFVFEKVGTKFNKIAKMKIKSVKLKEDYRTSGRFFRTGTPLKKIINENGEIEWTFNAWNGTENFKNSDIEDGLYRYMFDVEFYEQTQTEELVRFCINSYLRDINLCIDTNISKYIKLYEFENRFVDEIDTFDITYQSKEGKKLDAEDILYTLKTKYDSSKMEILEVTKK